MKLVATGWSAARSLVQSMPRRSQLLALGAVVLVLGFGAWLTWYLAQRTSHQDFPLFYRFKDGGHVCVATSRDGRLLCASAWVYGKIPPTSRIAVWDLRTKALLREIQAPLPVWSLALTPDGSKVASGNDDGTMNLWDTRTGGLLETIAVDSGSLEAIAFSPDGTRAATAGLDIRLWELSSGTFELRHTIDDSRCKILAYSADGQYLFIRCDPYTHLNILKAEDGGHVERLADDSNALIVLTQQGPRVVMGERAIRFDDVDLGRVRWLSFAAGSMKYHSESILRRIPLLVGSLSNWDGAITDRVIIEDDTQRLRHTTHLNMRGDRINTMRLAPDGSTLVAGGYAGGVYLWERVPRH